MTKIFTANERPLFYLLPLTLYTSFDTDDDADAADDVDDAIDEVEVDDVAVALLR
jgi:hypothetical protein